jgi:hypothetical protein
MNKYNTQFSILFLSLIFFSCSDCKYKNSRTFSLTDIKERKHLTGEIIEIDEIFIPAKLFLKDSLLFTVNHGQAYFISVFQLQNIKKIGDFIYFGSGPNEVLNVSNLQFRDSLIWLFDQSRQQINKYQLNQFLTKNEIVPCEIIRIEEPFEKVLITQNKVITNSLHHIRSRFSFYNLQGNFMENKGELPDVGVQMTDLELYESYFCNMVLNPNNESVFVAYMNTDLIEIYDSNGNLKTRRHGPDHFYSIKKEVSSGDEYRVRSIEGKTRDAYRSPLALEDEIWTIYDGKVFDRKTENSFLCNTIIVFDWNGNPIRQYTTDTSFYSLAIDQKNRVFYGITLNPEYAFVKFNY